MARSLPPGVAHADAAGSSTLSPSPRAISSIRPLAFIRFRACQRARYRRTNLGTPASRTDVLLTAADRRLNDLSDVAAEDESLPILSAYAYIDRPARSAAAPV
jgi:hypothetical protein